MPHWIAYPGRLRTQPAYRPSGSIPRHLTSASGQSAFPNSATSVAPADSRQRVTLDAARDRHAFHAASERRTTSVLCEPPELPLGTGPASSNRPFVELASKAFH
jgi:hypothetical protein